MNQYVTGTVIKELREKNQMTQAELAEKLCVSDKTISKWNTAYTMPGRRNRREAYDFYRKSGRRILYSY